MTSLELVKKLVEHGANLNARMTKKVNVGLDQSEYAGRHAILPGCQDARMPS